MGTHSYRNPVSRHYSDRGFGPAYADGSYVVGYFEMGGGYGRVERVAYVTAFRMS